MDKTPQTPRPPAACEWWTSMNPLGGTQELLLEQFGIKRTERSLQNVLYDLGIHPSHFHVHQDTHQGRVGYFDPLVCWAVLTAVESRLPRETLGRHMGDASQRASAAVWQDFPGGMDSAPESVSFEWQWRSQATAIHLFISDPRCGLHPYALTRYRLAKLHRHTLDSPECLSSTLSIYIESLARLAVDTVEDAKFQLSAEADEDRISRVLASLDSFGVLRASRKRLGPGPYVARNMQV